MATIAVSRQKSVCSGSLLSMRSFAINEILRYRGSPFPASRTLCHPGLIKYSDFRFPMSALLWAESLSCCSLWYFSFMPVQNWQQLDTVNYSLWKIVQKDYLVFKKMILDEYGRFEFWDFWTVFSSNVPHFALTSLPLHPAVHQVH